MFKVFPREISMTGIDGDLSVVNHSAAPPVPVGAAAVGSWLRVAPLSRRIALDNLIMIKAVEIIESGNGCEVHGCLAVFGHDRAAMRL